jgi:glutamate/aspartate transport system substrate-binding protein
MWLRMLTGAILLLAPPADANEPSSTLDKIKASGEVVIGHREASVPFSYLTGDGEPVGYSIDLCLAIVDEIEEELGLGELEVRFVAIDPQTRIPRLQDGTIDIECGSTTNSLSRQQEVDYGHTVFIAGTKLLVKRGSGINQIENLDGKTVAVTEGTTNEQAIVQIIEDKGLGVEVLTVADHDEGFRALESGRTDAYATDHILLHGLVSTAADPDAYAVVGRFMTYDPYAFMVRRNDADFRLVVNRKLSDLFRTGEIFGIYQKWFDPLGIPTSDLLEAAFAIQALPE